MCSLCSPRRDTEAICVREVGALPPTGGTLQERANLRGSRRTLVVSTLLSVIEHSRKRGDNPEHCLKIL
jgi:hypothetical protein